MRACSNLVFIHRQAAAVTIIIELAPILNSGLAMVVAVASQLLSINISININSSIIKLRKTARNKGIARLAPTRRLRHLMCWLAVPVLEACRLLKIDSIDLSLCSVRLNRLHVLLIMMHTRLPQVS